MGSVLSYPNYRDLTAARSFSVAAQTTRTLTLGRGESAREVAGFLFSSVAGYMAGLVGSSNNPVSGITIGTILFASLVLALLIVVVNTAVDVLVLWLDPRPRRLEVAR